MDYLLKNKIITTLVLVICLTNIIVVVAMFNFMMPGHRGHGFPPGKDGEMDMVDRQLGLTEQQQEKMTQLREAHMNEIDSHMDDMMEMRKEFMDEALKPELDRAKIEEFARKIGDKKAEFELSQIDFFQEITKILDAEQVEKLKKIMAEGPEHGPGRGPDHGPDRGGKHGPPMPPGM